MKGKCYILLIVLVMIIGPGALGQDFYTTSKARIAFFSSAPIEDIHAISNEGVSVLDPSTGEVAFKVPIQSFEFEKQKMEEHFNENFMESDRYPEARFRGTFSEIPDFSQPGTYRVTLEGVLEVHGRKKNRKIPAILILKDNATSLECEFKVACKDHDIKIPKILWQNIAEVVKVSVNANYTKEL